MKGGHHLTTHLTELHRELPAVGYDAWAKAVQTFCERFWRGCSEYGRININRLPPEQRPEIIVYLEMSGTEFARRMRPPILPSFQPPGCITRIIRNIPDGDFVRRGDRPAWERSWYAFLKRERYQTIHIAHLQALERSPASHAVRAYLAEQPPGSKPSVIRAVANLRTLVLNSTAMHDVRSHEHPIEMPAPLPAP